jgi:hypothetical protein
MSGSFFIGFGTFEDFLKACPTKDFYLDQYNETRAANLGTEIVDWFVTAAAPFDFACHYWRFPLGSYRTMDGSPVTVRKDEPARCAARAASMIDQLTTIANQRGITVAGGLLAFPKDLIVLSGTTTLLRYDEKTNSFIQNLPAVKSAAKIKL